MDDDRFVTLLKALPKARRFPREFYRGHRAAILVKPMRRITMWYLRGYIEGINRRFAFRSYPDREDTIE